MIFRARQFQYEVPGRILLMGIVNVTPDSFSDGGEFFTANRAVERAVEMAAEGADIIDIGGESSRPGAKPIPESEEMERVVPVIKELATKLAIAISIDTMKPSVARAAIAAGASMVNDVGANRGEDEMWRTVAETGAGYVLMHMKGLPETMQNDPSYGDVVGEVSEFFGERLTRMASCGVKEEQVVLDAGLGFGKRRIDNLRLLASLEAFTQWRRPLLVGASRKSFLGAVGTPPKERLAGSLACACWAAQHGAAIIRTHDVAATRQAIEMTRSLMDQK